MFDRVTLKERMKELVEKKKTTRESICDREMGRERECEEDREI